MSAKHWTNFLPDSYVIKQMTKDIEFRAGKLEALKSEVSKLEREIEEEERIIWETARIDWNIEEISEAKRKAAAQ